jgi:hypothetical protein
MIGTILKGGLDTGLRGAAIALNLHIPVAVLRRGGGRPVAWLGAALSVGAAAYVLCSLPDHPRSPWFSPLAAICAGNVVVFSSVTSTPMPLTNIGWLNSICRLLYKAGCFINRVIWGMMGD